MDFSQGAQEVTELPEISTEGIGFQTISGEAKLQLLPKPWPEDDSPPPTASLLSIASRKGLVAAAGSDSIVLVGTQAVRAAFISSAGGDTKSVTPHLVLDPGLRISQVAFSSDEEYMILSAENGGGLAVHQVSALLNGNQRRAFEISTNGESLRTLLPNPAPDSGNLCALVSVNGNLLIADLKSQSLLRGGQGEVMKNGVSTVAWSSKGKQLVAGLGDGSLVQMKPTGEVVANIAAPPGLEGVQFVSALCWIQNTKFLIVHTPTATDDPMTPPSTYHIITTPKGAPPAYQKLPELSPPFGLARTPAHQFFARLRDFPPDVKELVVVASTASTDIGLVTQASSALSNDVPADKLINELVTTQMADDSRRAQLPMSASLTDTSPIGIGFDLSANEKVKRPLPKEEYEESPGPLPLLMVLNNEGILAAWWLVYSDSIRQGTSYPGLVSIESNNKLSQTSVQTSSSGPFAKPAATFGSTLFGQPGGASPSPSPFANPSSVPSMSNFGSNSSGAFGAASSLGQKSSPWGGSANTNGTAAPSTTFGTPSQGSAFGVSGGLSNRASPWATPSTTNATPTGTAFGQASKLGSQTPAFGSATGTNAFSTPKTDSTFGGGGGFASFANKPTGFAASNPNTTASGSVFGQAASTSPFGTSNNTATSFGQPSPFGAAPTSGASPFSGGFKMESTFKADQSAKHNEMNADEPKTGSLFGGTFGSALGDTAGSAAVSTPKDDDMEDDSMPTGQSVQQPNPEPAKFPQMAPPKLSLPPQESTTPSTALGSSTPNNDRGSSAPKDKADEASKTPSKSSERLQTPTKPQLNVDPPEAVIKTEPRDISPLNDEEARPPEGFESETRGQPRETSTPKAPSIDRSRLPEPPLPPESTSKTTFGAGDSSTSSRHSDETPGPSEDISAKLKQQGKGSASSTERETQDTPGLQAENDLTDQQSESSSPLSSAPEEETRLDDEGSGVDVAQELSPPSSKESSKLTPGSSFTHLIERGSPTGFFSRPPEQTVSLNGKIPLFGEVGGASPPLFPPPAQVREGLRSPSPVRSAAVDSLRFEPNRSVSAPGPPSWFSPEQNRPAQVAVPAKSGSTLADARRREQEQMLERQRQKWAEEHEPLVDDEDEQIHRLLDSEVEPSRTLDSFIAHQDYVGVIDKPGIPGQVEKVFRDINSMVDTLGLNARSLAAFVKGHEQHDEGGRKSLDDPDEWCLIDVQTLDEMEDESFKVLESHKLPDASTTIADIRNTHKDLSHLRHQSEDLARVIEMRKDPSAAEASAQAPLSLDQQTQQRDLRKSFRHFQSDLARAEEGIALLRAKIAFIDSQNGEKGRRAEPSKQPTVEAIESTIRKMSGMIEKRATDLDALEMEIQMSGLNITSTPDTDRLLENGMNGLSLSSSHRRRGTASLSPASASKRRHGLANGSPSPLKSIIRAREEHANTPKGSGRSREMAPPMSPDTQARQAKSARRREINKIMREVFAEGAEDRVRSLETQL